MAKLNYKTICNTKTIAQIQAKVDFWEEQMEGATVEFYDKDTSQGRQKVQSARLNEVTENYQTYLKALECKMGLGGVNIVSQNFQGRC